MKDKRFCSMFIEGTEAIIDIYGDICSEPWVWFDSDVSAYSLSQKLEQLTDVDTIFVNINSYGGEVAEGIAIYNALRRQKAKIVTRCDGMACSIASAIFMAGDERIMYPSSMLMIHNAMNGCYGNANAMRKNADDLEKITSMSKAAYMERISITEDELSELMDAETWIGANEAVDLGFATSIEQHSSTQASQSALDSIHKMIFANQDTKRIALEQLDDPEELGSNPEPEQEPEQDPEPEQVSEQTDDPDDGSDGEEDTDADETKSEQSCRSFFEAAFK